MKLDAMDLEGFKVEKMKLFCFSKRKEGHYSHGIAMILVKDSANALIDYSPISVRIMTVRIQAKTHNISVIQCYLPTSQQGKK